jgi:hypothetical protein
MPRHPPENSPFDCAMAAIMIVVGAVQMYRYYKRWNDVIRHTWYSNGNVFNVFGQKYEWTGKNYFWFGFAFAMLGLWSLVFFCGWSPLSIFGPAS